MRYLRLPVITLVVAVVCSCSGGGSSEDTALADVPGKEVDTLCVPGEGRCTGDQGTQERDECDPAGSAWAAAPCGGGDVCAQDTGLCTPAVCADGESRCDGDPGSPDRSVCAPHRLGFFKMPCGKGQSCVALDGGDTACRDHLCEPGQILCGESFTAILTCDDTGANPSVAPCLDDQICEDAKCVPATIHLGDVMTVDFAQQPVSLAPGRYAMVVVDADPADDDALPYPASITGDVSDPPGVVASPLVGVPERSPFESRPCGTLAMADRYGDSLWPQPYKPPVPAEPVDWEVGDEKEFFFNFQPRTARLEAIGEHAYFWEDIGGDGLADAALPGFVDTVDNHVIPRDIAIFGPPTDVDNNGHIDIFVTHLLPSEGAAAYITAFDIYAGFGEIVYTMGAQDAWDVPALAGTLAHELQHLIYFGSRMGMEIDGDRYIVEGMAELAAAWSGQVAPAQQIYEFELLTQKPGLISLSRLFQDNYSEDMDTNISGYAFGWLTIEYLFDQAGAVEVLGSGGLVEDLGGIAYVDAVTTGPAGLDHINPLDGRTLDEWYRDYATALLALGLKDKLSAESAADSRYRFVSADDPSTGVLLGLSAVSPMGSAFKRKPWSKRGTTLRRGGMSFVEVDIGAEGADLVIDRPTTAVVLVRIAP